MTTDDDGDVTAYASQPLPRVETASDPEVEAVLRTAADAIYDVTGWRRCDLIDIPIRRAVEAGRAPLLKRIEELQETIATCDYFHGGVNEGEIEEYRKDTARAAEVDAARTPGGTR